MVKIRIFNKKKISVNSAYSEFASNAWFSNSAVSDFDLLFSVEKTRKGLDLFSTNFWVIVIFCLGLLIFDSWKEIKNQ